MQITLKTLTPIHIGSGKEITPLEYLIENNTFTRVDINGLFRDPAFAPMVDKFVGSVSTRRYIGDLVNIDLLKKYPLYSIPIFPEAKKSQINVKEYIKTAGRVFIPGSSIKGSILSAMLWYVLSEVYKKNPKRKFQEKEIPAQDIIHNLLKDPKGYNQLLDFAFSIFVEFASEQKRDRFGRWLAVSDSNSHNPQTSLAILLAKVVGGKGKSQLPILYEVVKSNTTFTLAATVQHAKVSLENILKITNTFYRRVLEEDRKEWKNEPVTFPIPKGTLLRLGQGATAYSTSFLILAKDIGLDSEYQRVTRVHPPKTRKRLEGGHPSFGWVEIS